MHRGPVSASGNFDVSDPSKIMYIIPKVHTEINSLVQAIFILSQITTTTLLLFREYLQQSHSLQKQYCCERTQEFSGSMSSQWVA